MAEGLDFTGQAETGRIDVAQQLVRERHVLLERGLDLLDLGVFAHQVDDAHDLRLSGVQRLGQCT